MSGTIIPEIQLGIIEGGDDSDPSPNRDGAVRVRILSEMGPGVKKEHLAFSKPMYPPHQGHGTLNSPPLDKGSLVLALNLPTTVGSQGSNFTTIIGHVQSIADNGGSLAGSQQNPVGQVISKLRSETKNVRLPPNIRETTKDGARIREAVEKDQDFALKVFNGIPSHGAIYPMAGIPLPELNNLATALQSYGNILTPSISSQLPGLQMSLGKMFSLFSGSMLNKILGSLPREIGIAFQSMSYLIQGFESSETGRFATAGKVHEETFMNNALTMLSGHSNLGGLIDGMMRLQMDTSLHGLDKFDPVTIAVNSAFGGINKQYDAYGNIVGTSIPDAIGLLIKLFSGLLTSSSFLPSADGQSSLFGVTSDAVEASMTRVPTEVEQARRQLITNLAQLPESTRVNSYMNKFINGGKVIG